MSALRRAVEMVSDLAPPRMLDRIRCTSSSSSRRLISSRDITWPLITAAGVSGNAGRAWIPGDERKDDIEIWIFARQTGEKTTWDLNIRAANRAAYFYVTSRDRWSPLPASAETRAAHGFLGKRKDDIEVLNICAANRSKDDIEVWIYARQTELRIVMSQHVTVDHRRRRQRKRGPRVDSCTQEKRRHWDLNICAAIRGSYYYVTTRGRWSPPPASEELRATRGVWTRAKTTLRFEYSRGKQSFAFFCHITSCDRKKNFNIDYVVC